MSVFNRPDFLRLVLRTDAATCIATGSLMSLAATPLSNLLELPVALLFYAGLSLLPIGVFIAAVSAQARVNVVAVWLIILGNVGWVAGSALVGLAAGFSPNALGAAFIAVQAVAVAVLAGLEYIGIRERPMVAAG